MNDEKDQYGLVLSKAARRALGDKLPATVAFAAWEFIKDPLRDNPRRVGAPLRKPFEGQWRARRGEYRIRYAIDDHKHTIEILDVDHRRDAYRIWAPLGEVRDEPVRGQR